MLQQLTPRVYQLDFSQAQDRPVLGYIRGDRFSLMVDAGNSPEHVQAYLAAVEESGFCQPDFVALTHSHWDHCFGLASLPMPSIACVQTRQSLEMVSRLQWTPDALAENVRKGIVPQLCAPVAPPRHRPPAPDTPHPPEIPFVLLSPRRSPYRGRGHW